MTVAEQVGSEAVRAAFAGGTDVDACVDLARRVNGLAIQAFEAFRDGGIACRVGCSFCCHLRVMVRPHEAIALYRELGSGIPKAQAAQVRQRVLDTAAQVRRLGPQAHAAARLPCAFLVDGSCSVYAARPLACAGFHSLDRGRCEQDYRAATEAAIHDGTAAAEGAGIPMLQGLGAATGLLEAGLDAGLAQRGLDARRAELHEAVAALIRNPSLIARWRAGRAL